MGSSRSVANRPLQEFATMLISFSLFGECIYYLLLTETVVLPLACVAGAVAYHYVFWRTRSLGVVWRYSAMLPVWLGLLLLLQVPFLQGPRFTYFSLVLFAPLSAMLYTGRWHRQISLGYMIGLIVSLLFPVFLSGPLDPPLSYRLNVLVFTLITHLITEMYVSPMAMRPFKVPSEDSIEPVATEHHEQLLAISVQLRNILTHLQSAVQNLHPSVPLDTTKRRYTVEIIRGAMTSINDISDNLIITSELERKRESRSVFNLQEAVRDYTRQTLDEQHSSSYVATDFDASIPQLVEGDSEFVRIMIRHILCDTLYDNISVGDSLTLSTRLVRELENQDLEVGVMISTGVTKGQLVLDPPLRGVRASTGERLSVQRDESGVKSRFTLLLHAVYMRTSASDSAGHKVLEAQAMSSTSGRGSTQLSEAVVLLAEDNPINRKVVGIALLGVVSKVEFATHGQEAVEMALKNHYSLILMDIQMPILDGISATRSIRKTELGRRTPIIGLTAYSHLSDKQACLDAGMDGYIAKPFQNTTLLSLMAKVLRERGGEQVGLQDEA